MNTPLVSVCIPVYNMEAYVGETLTSLQSQTYTNFEAIIVDDGSTDGSRSVIEPFLSDRRFQYVFQENRGLAGARTTALEIARGEWFAQLDADDIWLSYKLEKQIELANEDPRANLIYGNMIAFWPDGREEDLVMYKDIVEGDITKVLYAGNVVPAPSAMIKTQDLRAIGGYSPQRFAEDWDMLIRLCRKGIWARACRFPVGRYRKRPGSLSNCGIPVLETCIQTIERFMQSESDPELFAILAKQANQITAQARSCPRMPGSQDERSGDGTISMEGLAPPASPIPLVVQSVGVHDLQVKLAVTVCEKWWLQTSPRKRCRFRALTFIQRPGRRS